MNQAYDDGTGLWDNGYPSGGNYWDDYTGEPTGAITSDYTDWIRR